MADRKQRLTDTWKGLSQSTVVSAVYKWSKRLQACEGEKGSHFERFFGDIQAQMKTGCVYRPCFPKVVQQRYVFLDHSVFLFCHMNSCHLSPVSYCVRGESKTSDGSAVFLLIMYNSL